MKDTSRSPAIQAHALTKVYGQLTALADASFSVMAGEIRALVGSNGAGKSTLIKILTGAITPTAGSVEVNGQAVALGDPTQMMRRGVACIYQHPNLAPAMTVLDNIFLGRQPTRRMGFLDRKRQRREAFALLAQHGVDLDLDAVVSTLSTTGNASVVASTTGDGAPAAAPAPTATALVAMRPIWSASTSIVAPFVSSTARSIWLRSSRTLPGQSCVKRYPYACCEISRAGRPYFAANSRRKCSASP